jgi:hypothetical protein
MTILVIIESEPAVPRFIPVAIDDVQTPGGPAYLVDGILGRRCAVARHLDRNGANGIRALRITPILENLRL